MKIVHSRGFSLIELMVVIGITAVLASIAMPSYQRHTLKINRAEAFGQLLRLQSNYETAYSQNNTYPATAITIPRTTHYSYSTSNLTQSTYTLTATAQGSQASDSEGSTSCATLTLDNQGGKGDNAACWSQ